MRLWEACRKENVDMFVRLIRFIRVNRPYQAGVTYLMQSAHFGSLPLVKLLVEHGANVNALSEDGNTALIYAATKGYSDIAKYLVEQGAEVNVQTKVRYFLKIL